MPFDAFRVNKLPTSYGDNKTPWMADVVEGGLAFCAVILFVSFLLVMPGIRGWEKLFSFIRVTFMIFVGTVILVSLFAQSWEVGYIDTHTQYKAGVNGEIEAEVGLHIGLRGINITLKAKNETTSIGPYHNEIINYNEHFSWEWSQGRAGFGQFAGRFNREFREAQRRGTPYPILWVAEYFTLDGEGIRWGRFYRQAGWYSHILLWLSFALLMVAIIMTYVLIRYATYVLALCGSCILLADIVFATFKNVNDLKIPVGDSKERIEPKFAWTFILTLITGLLTIFVAVLLFAIDMCRHDLVVKFFGVDALQDAEDEMEVEDKVLQGDEPVPGVSMATDGDVMTNGGASHSRGASASDDDTEVEHAPKMPPPKAPKYRSREDRMTKMFKQKQRRSNEPPPRPRRKEPQTYEQDIDELDDREDYENADTIAHHGHVMIDMDKPRKVRRH